MLSSRVLKSVPVLRKQFERGTPFPHVVIKEVFEKRFALRVREVLLKQNFKDVKSDLYEFKETDDLKHSKDPFLKEVHAFFVSDQLRSFVERVTGKALGRGVDVSGFTYGSTHYLLPHDDRVEGRKIAFVYNLSKNFSSSDGGRLRLYACKQGKPYRVHKSYVPGFNSLVVFEVARESFHEVEEVQSDKVRVSLAGWFHGT